MRNILGERFFDRPTRRVAQELLGKFLVVRLRSLQARRRGGKTEAFMITEVEAYDGFKDRASHASHGKTGRNAPMFGPAGRWYVYFTYGMHWMLNIVCGREGYPAAVLIRGAEGINGPARLTRKLKIDKKFNGKPADRKTGLWIENRGIKIPPSKIKKSPRVGVHYAGRRWAGKPWRFAIVPSVPPRARRY